MFYLLPFLFQKMDYRDFNGPDFKYKVQWRRAVGSGPKWHESNTTAHQFLVNGVGNFSAFEIKVQAVNAFGDGPEPDPVIGYSGEDGKIFEIKHSSAAHFSFSVNVHTLHGLSVPLEAPMDVGVQLINSTAIKVSWFTVDRESVRGHLLGYKVLLLHPLLFIFSV